MANEPEATTPHLTGRGEAGWQFVTVFVSSTFRDMHAERDWLQHRVFPELAERLRARRCHLAPIDLRLGVKAATVEDEQAHELTVLQVCLDEIRSASLFVALLGDRYGWVPPRERMKAAVRDAGLRGEFSDRSITALEIEYRLLQSSPATFLGWFYFRDPLPYEEMDHRSAEEYSDALEPSPEQRLAAEKLVHLKQRIESLTPDRVRHYRADWDHARRRVTGLEQWGRQVLEDLWRDLDEPTRGRLRAAPSTWQEEERWVIDQFVEDRARDFKGHSTLIGELCSVALGRQERSPVHSEYGRGARGTKELVEGTAECGDLSSRNGGPAWGVCVTGAPGAGKSSAFSRLHRLLEGRQEVLLLSHAAGVSVRSNSVDAMVRRFVHELAAFLNEPPPLAAGTSTTTLDQAFAQLLGAASAKRRVVVLVDALDQFEPTPRARCLTWLPRSWPDNARLIATCLPGPPVDAIRERAGTRTMSLPLMTRQEAEQVAEAICNRRHRKIGAEVLDAIASRWGGGPDAPGGGINPLWLELAVEELNLLDADDFARMEHEFADLHPAERQQRLWLEKAAQLPASVEELYDWMLTRTERLNRDWSIALSTLLAVGRSGWREGDLRALLPAITDERWKTVPFGSKGWRDLHLSGEAWQDLLFAILRRGFLGHLVQRGTLMQWDFRHAQMRTAVRRRHLAGPALLRHLHGTVARYLESLPADDPLRQSELMFHWIEADEPERAARLFAEDLPPPALEGATQALAARAREGLTAEGVHPGLDWVLDLLHEPTLSDGTRARLCLRYISVLRQAVEQDLPPQTMAAFLGKVEAKLRDMAESDPRDPNWSLAWAYVSDEVGQCLVEVGRLGEALAVFKKSLAIRLRLTAARPGDTLAARALALSHARIAEPLRRTGRLKEARESLESALSIRESLAQKDPDNLSLQAELAKTLEDLGSVNQDLGDLASARQKYEAALLIRGQLAARKEPFQYGCVDSGADRLVGLSASHIGLGEVLQAQGDLHGALDQLHSARKARQQLLDSDPRNVTCQRDLAVAHIKVGMVQQVLGCLSAAAESFRNAAALRERLARLDPTRLDREYDLAVSRCSLGGALHDQGDLDGALAAFEAYRSGMERLVQLAPSNYEWLRERWRSEVKIGEVLRSKRDFRGAYEAYHRNLEGVQSLVKQFPHNAESRHELAAAHNYIGFALQGMGDHEGALESYRAYRQGMEELVRLDPSNKTWRRDLIATHACLGAAYLALGDPEKAQSEYREFTEEMERLLETSPDNASWRRDLAVGYGRIADLFQRQGRLDEALSVRLECHDTFASLAEPDPSNAIAQRDLAVSFCALAQLCGERMEPALAEQNLQRCLLILTGMEEAGMYLDDPLRALLEDYERN